MVVKAVEQLQRHVRAREQIYKDGGVYEMASVRSVLQNMNYSPAEQNEILDFLHRNGFNYCLDPRFPSKDFDDGKETPTPEFACWWGIDQLRSRLDSVYVGRYSE